MCGIFGVWNFKGVQGQHLLNASKLLAHRGPDGEGIAVSESEGMVSRSGVDFPRRDTPTISQNHPVAGALVHRRLSIIDLSEKADQPMRLHPRNIHITYNGEVYNYRELSQRFGLKLRTASDTEVILALYDRLGLEAFSHLHGMWGLAILDLERNRLVLSRDRFGIKPLYYTLRNGGLAFSSELKPLLQLPGMRHTWKEKSLLEFATFGATSDPDETFAHGIHALKPGHLAVYDLHNLSFETKPYYTLPKFGEGKPQGEFGDLFRASIDEHLVSDVEVGSCLSGGIDSGLIVAESAAPSRQAERPFRTFTCTFPGSSIDESSHARGLADVVPNLSQHFVSPNSEALMNRMDELVTLQERPIGSASVFAQFSVMNLVADNGVKVVLDGQGADEVFGGYYPFAGAFLLTALKSGKFRLAKREYAALKSRFNPRMDTAMLRAGYYALPAFLQSYFRRSGRMGYDLLAPAHQPKAKALGAPLRGSADFNQLTARSIGFGLKELLHYEDRNSMHFGVESRVPFLDHRLVEWAVLSPPEAKLYNGWTKWPLRRELERLGAAEHAWRIDKLGFVAPQDAWRRELAGQMAGEDFGDVGAAYFDAAKLRGLFTRSLEGSVDHTAFWRFYFLLRWLKTFKVDIV